MGRKKQWKEMVRWLETAEENYSRWTNDSSDSAFAVRVYAKTAEELRKDIEWIKSLVDDGVRMPPPGVWAMGVGVQALCDLMKWEGPLGSDSLLVDALAGANIWDVASSAVELRDMD